MSNMATPVVSSHLFRLISLSVLLWTASSVPPTWAETIVSDVEPAPAAEQGEPAAAEAAEPADAPISPSVQLSGSIWRSKPGIVFLQTPIGPLSLSSKTTLCDIRGSQKITLWIHGSTTVIDIREKGARPRAPASVSRAPHRTSRDR